MAYIVVKAEIENIVFGLANEKKIKLNGYIELLKYPSLKSSNRLSSVLVLRH